MQCRFPDVSFMSMLKLIFTHQLLNRLFPLRTGELSIPFFLNRINNISYSDSVPALILIRILDILSLFISCFLFLILIYFTGFSFPFSNNLIFLFLITFSILLFVSKKLDYFFPKFINILNVMTLSRFNSIFNEIKINLVASFLDSEIIYNKLFFYSIIDKFLQYLIAVILILGIGYNFEISIIIFACAFSAITEILPISSIGNFGTLELGWSIVLIYYGIEEGLAISSGFEYHLLSLSFTIFFGLVGVYYMGYDFIFNRIENEK